MLEALICERELNNTLKIGMELGNILMLSFIVI